MSLNVSSNSNYTYGSNSVNFGNSGSRQYQPSRTDDSSKNIKTARNFAILSGICSLGILGIASYLFFKVRSFEPVLKSFESQVKQSEGVVKTIANFLDKTGIKTRLDNITKFFTKIKENKTVNKVKEGLGKAWGAVKNFVCRFKK